MCGRSFGYARVSTDDQNLALQLDALTKLGIPSDRIFKDKFSGAKCDRPGLTKCLESLEGGDVLIVWRLDRLGRSMRHLITIVEDLRDRGIGFRSIQEGAIDTTTASGELIFNIFQHWLNSSGSLCSSGRRPDWPSRGLADAAVGDLAWS